MKKNNKELKFESLNGNVLSKIQGGQAVTKSSQATDHACGRHGCGYNAGTLIVNR